MVKLLFLLCLLQYKWQVKMPDFHILKQPIIKSNEKGSLFLKSSLCDTKGQT